MSSIGHQQGKSSNGRQHQFPDFPFGTLLVSTNTKKYGVSKTKTNEFCNIAQELTLSKGYLGHHPQNQAKS